MKLINIQGLTNAKMIELLEILQEKDGETCILFMTETQQKFRRVDFGDKFVQLEKMRDVNDKKGGGLMVVMRQMSESSIEELRCADSDVLRLMISIHPYKLNVFLVYIDGKSNQRMEHSYRAMECELQKMTPDEMLVVLGDFNGHVGFLGSQPPNKHGNRLLDFLEKWNLILLNADQRCTGEITRAQGTHKSAIDFVLVNQAAYRYFAEMHIDEDQQLFELSDHRLVQTAFQLNNRVHVEKRVRFVTEYYRTNCDTLKEAYLTKMEKDLQKEERERGGVNQETLEKLIKQNCELILKKRLIKRNISDNGGNRSVEPVWMTEEIRREIKIRRQYNKEKRKAAGERLEELLEKYKVQKYKVQMMIKQAKRAHEVKLTKEVREAKDSGKKMFEIIHKLRGKTESANQLTTLYDKKGIKLDKNKLPQEVYKFWSSVYQQHDNELYLEWNEDCKRQYKDIEKEQCIMSFNGNPNRITIPSYLQEHFDVVEGLVRGRNKENIIYMKAISFPPQLLEHMDVLAGQVEYRTVTRMEWARWKEIEVVRALKNIKNGKQPGPDHIKGEIMKWMADSRECLKFLTASLNEVVVSGECPNSWKKSKTVMIPKVNKPNVEQLRPVALTNCTYKLLMSLIKEQVYDHLARIGELNDLQAGFTKGRRMEDNVFMLEYCIRDSRERRKELIILAMDFEKAFDLSIDVVW